MSLSKFLLPPLLIVLSLPIQAQLPTLPDKPWIGHFIGHERRDFRFGVKEDGEMVLECFNNKGTAMGFSKAILFDIEIVEAYPDRQSVKKIIAESLVTTDKASDKPEKVSFKGKVTGDAEFEVFLEFDDDIIKFGGRILTPGSIKNPLTFRITSRYQNVYSYTAKEKLEDETEKDRIEFITLDKKRDKIGIFEPVDLASEKITGKGLSNVRVELKPLEGKRFEYSIEGPGHISLANPRGLPTAPMLGFSVHWNPDPAKDPDAKARFVLEVK